MKILWLRIVLAAVVLELLYGAFLVFALGSTEVAFTAVGILLVLLFMMVGGAWVGRRATSHRVLQGALVGIAAVLLYTVLTTPVMLSGELPITVPLLLNHLAKVLGGGMGGWLSATLFARKAVRSGVEGQA